MGWVVLYLVVSAIAAALEGYTLGLKPSKKDAGYFAAALSFILIIPPLSLAVNLIVIFRHWAESK